MADSKLILVFKGIQYHDTKTTAAIPKIINLKTKILLA